MSPHLFTHLFHGGVILSTRKLVYDAGSAEEAIKALMQAQHKAVLKDLKKGSFDDKIDQYLGDIPGLLPRGAVDPGDAGGRDSELMMTPPAGSPPIAATPPTGTPVVTAPAAARTQTAERKSAPSQVRTSLPPPPPADGFDPPTVSDDPAEIAAAMANATVRNLVPPSLDSSPEIILQLELDDSDPIADPTAGRLDEPSGRTRTKHDTDVQMPDGIDARAATISDGVPGSIGGSASTRARAASVPPLPPTPERRTGDRGSAVGAATLPPARPITRPPSRPAIAPPTVVSRPLPDDARGRHESDAIEVYAPAPPSVEAPPGTSERPGQYAQHKRASQKIPLEGLRGDRERSASIPVPSGLSRPGRASGPPAVPPPTPTAPASAPVPRPIGREPSPGIRPPDLASRPTERPRTPTPSRLKPPTSSPVTGRTGSGGTSSGGVVMTRPAVIVGAPAKPATPPRVRKAREEEGRGFGQGLISEKSLDEVILAYLSEDADDK